MADIIFNAGDNIPAADYSGYDNLICQNTTGVLGTITIGAGDHIWPRHIVRTTGAGNLTVTGIAANPNIIFSGDIEGINFTSIGAELLGSGITRFRGDIDVTGLSSFNFGFTAPLIFDKAGDQNIDTGAKSLNGILSVENVPKNINFLSVANFQSADVDGATFNYSVGVASQVFAGGVTAKRCYFNAAAAMIFAVLGAKSFINCKFKNINALVSPFTAYNSEDNGGNPGITFTLTMPRGQMNMLGVGL